MLICLVGPSGAGKTTIEKELVAKYGFTALKSHSTRPKRYPEEDTYHFVTKEEFDKLEFVEINNPYGDAFYGLTKSEVDKTADLEKDFVVTAEMHGCVDLVKYCECGVYPLFITAPLGELVDRLSKRTASEAEKADRIAKLKRDMLVSKMCDGVVSNEDGKLEKAMADVLKYKEAFEAFEFVAKMTIKAVELEARGEAADE